MAEYRLPIFRDAPIRHKFLACEPLLERIDLAPHLGPWVEQVIAGGESGNAARHAIMRGFWRCAPNALQRGLRSALSRRAQIL